MYVPKEQQRTELDADDFISSYLSSLPESEVPLMFERWSALVGLGAYIGKRAWFQHADSKVSPNLYVMLIADSGVRKSTAIKRFVRVLRKAGFENFAAQKTSKEQFLLDLAEAGSGRSLEGERLTNALFAEADAWSINESDSANMFAAPDEFNELFGNNILEFVSLLGTLWDWEGIFENKVKNSKSVCIPNPCVSLLGGNTPATLYGTFPPETIGQGFFSRVLFIHSPHTGKKIAFPRKMDEELMNGLVECLHEIDKLVSGEMQISKQAIKTLEECYHTWPGILDSRFVSYGNRRFTQLIKLVVIHALADYSKEIKEIHVIRANTVLSQAEKFMPKGLGQFGKARNSEVIHNILLRLEGAEEPVKFRDIWAHVSSDLSSPRELQDIMSGLALAEKIQTAGDGFLLARAPVKQMKDNLLDWNYLSHQERELT